MKKKKQFGRSMIEMLGVLAVIGVLSITALAGFQYAMNKHRANETIHDVMLRASNVPMIDEDYLYRPEGYEWLFAGLSANGHQGTYYSMATLVSDLPEYVFKVEIPDVPKKVCRQILALNPTDIDAIYVEGDKLTDSDACPNELNTMAFYFDEEWGNHENNPDSNCPPARVCGDCEIKAFNEHGCLVCVKDPSCSCSEGTTACGEENCCVDGEESCLSNGMCCPSSQVCEQTCCGAGQGCVDGLCQCVDEPDECGPCEELQTNPDTGCKECILPKEAVPCGVICCEAGQVCTNNETACCKAENVCGDTCCPDGVACDAEKGVCGCSSDADCCPENPCMKCVQNETLGVGECQMVGSLYNSGSGLSCCTHPNRAYFSQFSASGCDDTCFNGHPNEQTVCGQTYGVGNSCCPSELSEEAPSLGICGAFCMDGGLGVPALSREGNLSCCGFERHVCPVKGLQVLTGEMETKCCLKGQIPYYNQNDKKTTCCNASVLPVVGGIPGTFHCCGEGQKPYWTDDYGTWTKTFGVKCCSATNLTQVAGKEGSYGCCSEGQQAYVYGYEDDGVPTTGYNCCPENYNVGSHTLNGKEWYYCCPEGEQGACSDQRLNIVGTCSTAKCFLPEEVFIFTHQGIDYIHGCIYSTVETRADFKAFCASVNPDGSCDYGDCKNVTQERLITKEIDGVTYTTSVGIDPQYDGCIGVCSKYHNNGRCISITGTCCGDNDYVDIIEVNGHTYEKCVNNGNEAYCRKYYSNGNCESLSERAKS